MSGTSPEAILYDISGNTLAVQNGTAIPASTPGLIFMGSDGTNSRYVTVDSSGRPVIVGAGVAGTPAGGVVSIQGVTGGTVVPVSGTVTANIGTTNGLALDTSVNGILLAQNSTTSGQTGPLIQGAVTTAAPAYTTAKTSPLSLTTAGALRIDGSAVTQPVSGTVTANIGTTNGLALDATLAKLTITQGTALGANTQALVGGSVTTASPTYTTGNINPFSLTTAGALRIDGSAVTQPVSGTVTANIGTTNGLALDATLTGGTQTTRITDGTNTATVKAASTAAVATDKALVVAISPNNSVVVTQATAANLNAQVQGAGASGSAVTGNPVLMAGSDGTNARTIKTLTDGTQVTRYKELATFTAVATDTAVSNNKSVLSIVNASGSTVTARISAIYLTSVQTTSVTGVVGNFELRRITNHSVGTAITAIETMNTADSLNSSITVRTGSTVTSESANLLWRSVFSTDEWSVNSAIDTAAMGHLLSTMFPIWKKADNDNKPIILNANEGLTVKFATNSTVGTFDIMVVFTQE